MGGGQAFAYEDKTTTYYDTIIKAQDLGNYKFNITTHEVPSQEWIPIISKDYFPVTVASFVTEVDNTAPSAKYKSKPVTKVDVVFALGELNQMKQLESYMTNFESKLMTASNSLDAQITSVETVAGGFDMADADVETIYNFWDQYPNPNNFTLNGNKLINAVYEWNGYPSSRRPGSTSVFNQVFIESNSWEATDFEIQSLYAWHGCRVPSGYIFRFNKEENEAYILELGKNVRRGNGATLYKVKNVTGLLGKKNDTSASDATWLANYGQVLKYQPHSFSVSGQGDHVSISMKDNTIEVKVSGKVILEYTDTDPIGKGGIGLFAGCTVSYSDIQLSYETIAKKTLGEAISDVIWRDNAVRFVIHATDVVPEECLPGNEGNLQYTITKLLNSNAYLINLGTSINKTYLDRLVKNITLGDNEQKGTFYYNSPITAALNNSAQWILDKTKNLSKPTDYILVNTEILWETEYNDYERDVPLNYGGNKDDKAISNAWGIGLTNLYNQDKIMAEKWRYRHKNTFYDNSPIIASFDDTWIPDPIEMFDYPGLYRINYKRRDNPFYTNTNLAYPFDSYRYWSTDYDLRVSGEN